MKVSASFQHFLRWLGQRLFRQPPEAVAAPPTVRVRPPSERPTSAARPAPRREAEGRRPASVRLNATVNGRIADGGPGKNVLIRKMVREDTGTHDTLKILDQSALEPEEEYGIDPYNTGRFDRAKSWETRFRK